MSGSFFKRCYGNFISIATSTSVFGEKMTYRPLAGGRFTLKAVFDQNFEQITPDTEVIVSVNAPRIEAKLSRFRGAPRQGDKVEIYNTDRKLIEEYEVNEIQEDGQGGVVLHLTLLSDEHKEKSN